MDDSLIQDSLKVAEKAISVASNKSDPTNVWIWIAIGEFVIIVGLLLARSLKKKPNAKQKFKKEALAHEVDFNNIINSSFHSTELYDILKDKCHPDRFPANPELNEIAEKLFQEITRNKANLKRLEELKIEAQYKLNIKI